MKVNKSQTRKAAAQRQITVRGNWNCRTDMEAESEGEVIARGSIEMGKDGQNPFILGQTPESSLLGNNLEPSEAPPFERCADNDRIVREPRLNRCHRNGFEAPSDQFQPGKLRTTFDHLRCLPSIPNIAERQPPQRKAVSERLHAYAAEFPRQTD
jgi:hypothetical protein